MARTPKDEGLFLSLAPMDGVTDAVHRELATRIGGVSQCVSEFVRVTDGAVHAKVFLRDVPELKNGGVTSSGVPVFVQILGGSPEAMAASAKVAAALGAPGIDINFGCPAKRVNNHDGGAAILRCPERAERITRAVRDAVKHDVPVTVKIRVGWADSDSVVELAERVERAGASWLTIHGRTKLQMYAPPVDYRAIGRAVAATSMPVVANGDIVSCEAMQSCATQSGARSFMVGRGALAQPFVFHVLRGQPVPQTAFSEVLADYAELLLKSGLRPDGSLRRIKQWLGLGAALDPAVRPYFERAKRCEELTVALSALHDQDRNDRAA